MPQLDSSFIATGLKPPQIEDPLQSVEAVQRLQLLKNQAALQPLQAAKIQSDIEQTGLENEKIRNANQVQQRTTRGQQVLSEALQKYAKVGDDGKTTVDHEGVQKHLTEAGFGPEALNYGKEKRAELDDALKRKKEELAVTGTKATQLGSYANSVLNAAPELQGAVLKDNLKKATSDGLIDQATADQISSQVGPDGALTPEVIERLKNFARTAQTVEQQQKSLYEATAETQKVFERAQKRTQEMHAKVATLFTGVNDKETYDQKVKEIATEDPAYAKQYLERLPFNPSNLKIIQNRALTAEQRATNSTPKATWESILADPNETPERKAQAKAVLDDIQKRAIATDVGKQTGAVDALLGGGAGGAVPTGSVVIPETAPGQKGQQLAFKNNNPGNLMFANQPGAELGEGGFAKFKTPEDGYAAIGRQIGIDAKAGLTLEGYITKYAPAGHGNNDPVAYTKAAAAALGVDPKTPLGTVDANKLAAFQAQQESSTKVAAATPTATEGGFNEAALQGKNPALVRQVKNIVDGREFLPPQAGRGPIAMKNQAIADLVRAYDPSFDITDAKKRVVTANAYAAGGKIGQNINAIGTAMKHGGELSDAIEALDNTRFPKYNSISNWIKNNVGSDEVKRFENIRTKYADELTKAWVPAGGSVADREEQKKAILAADSPDVLRKIMMDNDQLMRGKYTELESAYKSDMGKPLTTGISKEAVAASEKIRARANAGDPSARTVTLKKPVNGKSTFIFPSKEAADSFKREHSADVN